jgi:hypothetical protein
MLKNSLGVLRRSSDERRAFDIIEDFPFMLRLSKHSEPFSATYSTTPILQFYNGEEY